MASRTIEVFKSIGGLDLKIDIYTKKYDPTNGTKEWSPDQPVVLFIHVEILCYYGCDNFQDEFFNMPQFLGPTAITREQIEPLLQELMSTGSISSMFNPQCLLPDLKRNPGFKMPDRTRNPRMSLFIWYSKKCMLPEMMGGIDTGFEDASWKKFQHTILLHGENDIAVPYKLALDLAKSIGLTPAKLFTAVDQLHVFDEP
ncbi:hypothetical protein G7Y89_g13414 [Cudoniella acicularis]|uniref:Uncharacterized protein n=1 Tax=Cudoniella acicularis TaxID=354080 RepID=A0A8H4R9N9_9HELO|nr:hypothetical protein G7Y89_g13414 [Cudoniella acicularis]